MALCNIKLVNGERTTAVGCFVNRTDKISNGLKVWRVKTALDQLELMTLIIQGCCPWSRCFVVQGDIYSHWSWPWPWAWGRCYQHWCNRKLLYTVWVNKNPPLRFLKFFPKRLGILNNFFTHILYDHFYTRVQIFIQISPTLTKLCHTKRDHLANFYISLEL